MGHFLGVDIGTSSSKGVLTDAHGSVIASAVRHHAPTRPAPGHVEMEADLWWQEFTEIATELTGAAPPGSTIGAVGVSGMGPCVMLTDASGAPLRPAILYGVDTRAEAQIDAINAELGEDRIFEETGTVLSSQSAGPKLRWVRDNEPDLWRRARRFFMPSSWLAYKLTGTYVLDHHSASQSTPMYDLATGDWNPWAPRIAEHLELPELRWAGEIAGRTRTETSGIPEGTPVITGTIDAWSEAVSVGAHNPGDLMIMYGTTMFLIASTDTQVDSPTLWSTAGAYEGNFNLAGGMATSGAITNWFADLTGADFPALIAEAEASRVGANGLLVLPYFAGERTPIFDPDARGVIAGLTLNHTRGDIYRAVLEATAFGVRHNLEAMNEAGAGIERIIAVGGGVQSDLWTSIVSSVTGLSQAIPAHTIGASYGAAMLAAQTQGVDTGGWNPPVRHVHPDPADAAVYDDLYELYRELYPATTPITRALAARQR